jgi:hypothetical protein
LHGAVDPLHLALPCCVQAGLADDRRLDQTQQNPQLPNGRNMLHDGFGLRCMHADGSLQQLLPGLCQQQLKELVEFFSGVLAFNREVRWGSGEAASSALFSRALALVQKQLPDEGKRQRLLDKFRADTDSQWQD